MTARSNGIFTGGGLLRSASVLTMITLLALPAQAQNTGVAQPAGTPTTPGLVSRTETLQSQPETATPEGADIVVTASRIQRSGFTAPTPTTIIGAGAIANHRDPSESEYRSHLQIQGTPSPVSENAVPACFKRIKFLARRKNSCRGAALIL